MVPSNGRNHKKARPVAYRIVSRIMLNQSGTLSLRSALAFSVQRLCSPVQDNVHLYDDILGKSVHMRFCKVCRGSNSAGLVLGPQNLVSASVYEVVRA